ncbi:hypothetical protein GCM10023085_24370 [Actinomadura viridis]
MPGPMASHLLRFLLWRRTGITGAFMTEQVRERKSLIIACAVGMWPPLHHITADESAPSRGWPPPRHPGRHTGFTEGLN